ncbi:hypothetical protein EN829_066835 [Mesorhizobium sp. M00.F.Ca.ET.186.01.1.1]|nr:hypothetical protein EN829_066835 [Mesorhizobium sp. M00.F.Ca.ET.186.01.1.1]
MVELSGRLFQLVEQLETTGDEKSWPLRVFKCEEPRLAPDEYRIAYAGNTAEAKRLYEKQWKIT